jgi:hypothetical protein
MQLIVAKRNGHLGRFMKPLVEGSALRVREDQITQEMANQLGFETVFECCMDARRAAGVSLNNFKVQYWLISGEFICWADEGRTRFDVLKEKCLKAEEIARKLAGIE